MEILSYNTNNNQTIFSIVAFFVVCRCCRYFINSLYLWALIVYFVLIIAVLNMDWREKVTKVSERVFPGLSHTNPRINGNEVMSNLPLQMSLFFNVTFFPVWLLIMAAYLRSQYSCFNHLHQFVLIIVLTSIILTEILRLYLGYVGNLKDKISELAAFWLLSMMLQVPLELIILINPYFKWQVVEFVVHCTMSLMLLFQIVISYFALKSIAAHQATVFRILKMKKEELENVNKNKRD